MMGKKPGATESKIAEVSAKSPATGCAETHQIAAKALVDGTAGMGGVVVVPVGIAEHKVDFVCTGRAYQAQPMLS